MRDKEIDRLGERVGSSFVVIGGLGALVLAMLDVDCFWIANAMYLAFVLSARVSERREARRLSTGGADMVKPDAGHERHPLAAVPRTAR